MPDRREEIQDLTDEVAESRARQVARDAGKEPADDSDDDAQRASLIADLLDAALGDDAADAVDDASAP